MTSPLAAPLSRSLVNTLAAQTGQDVLIRGWVYRLRGLAKTTFVVLKDVSGLVQCVAASESLKGMALKLDDAVEIFGRVRAEPRSKTGFELDIQSLRVLNPSAENLPFQSSSDISAVSPEILRLSSPESAIL